ncbi:YebC/PmpR family DNA-binding transcriptional regulator [Candidatus Campbellbacteria bacterium CG22_combo_CG10-13_8_21_14_all_36_13]|uniref:YebC/PmpR family DNA-binding transcriptional regulator n=1 Tax=Candidatus Campbellbacteria bacterium CG22_combo_CG10-13_8_21_14_all_36_13 TaxID=1974529 RepID=A0A2H0DZ33_9BACT|nr:MAG: YebC/PmpR family DNA-binding transcriptional regulator [Candidatus Campbellbacteria bacterium CG22_combo_CG10-13_8_21_14_all_36_13]
MSGHNKWSKIKHKKEATDAQKSRVFSRLVKLIQVESKRAGGNTNDPGLRAVIEKAKKENMPKDNIDRAVKKGAGADSANLESITYEAYGPGGVAIIIETLTDNRNRAAAEVRHILSKNNCELAAQGSALWAFNRVGGAWEATTTTTVDGSFADNLNTLIEQLEECEDVQEVFTNASSE